MRPLRFPLAWIVSLAGLTAIQSHAFAGEDRDAGSRHCERWLTRTLDAVESSPMLRRRDVVVSATARSCVGVSEALQAAARLGQRAQVAEENLRAIALGVEAARQRQS